MSSHPPRRGDRQNKKRRAYKFQWRLCEEIGGHIKVTQACLIILLFSIDLYSQAPSDYRVYDSQGDQEWGQTDERLEDEGFFTPPQEQENYRPRRQDDGLTAFGPVLGLGFNDLNGESSVKERYENDQSFFLGAKYLVLSSPTFGVALSALYDRRRFKESSGSGEIEHDFFNLIPRVQFGFEQGPFVLFAGARFGISMGYSSSEGGEEEKLLFGAVLGGGLMIPMGEFLLNPEIFYDLSFSDFVTSTPGYKANAIGLELGLLFF